MWYKHQVKEIKPVYVEFIADFHEGSKMARATLTYERVNGQEIKDI